MKNKMDIRALRRLFPDPPGALDVPTMRGWLIDQIHYGGIATVRAFVGDDGLTWADVRDFLDGERTGAAKTIKKAESKIAEQVERDKERRAKEEARVQAEKERVTSAKAEAVEKHRACQLVLDEVNAHEVMTGLNWVIAKLVCQTWHRVCFVEQTVRSVLGGATRSNPKLRPRFELACTEEYAAERYYEVAGNYPATAQEVITLLAGARPLQEELLSMEKKLEEQEQFLKQQRSPLFARLGF